MDGRSERGERSRRTVARSAAAIASINGLSGMTLSQLADTIGVSKSSVQAAYKTKEDVQVAAVAAASTVFFDAVVQPAMDAAEGLPRLLALVDSWLAYVDRRVFPGGCFMVATLAEYDSRPGSVRDALARARRSWLKLLERQADVAQAAGQLPPAPSAALVAFEVDALLSAANIARNFTEDTAALRSTRGLIALRLGG